MPADDSVTFEQYENLLRLREWADAENEFDGTHDPLGVPSRSGAPVRPQTGIPAEPNFVTTMQASGPAVSRR